MHGLCHYTTPKSRYWQNHFLLRLRSLVCRLSRPDLKENLYSFSLICFIHRINAVQHQLLFSWVKDVCLGPQMTCSPLTECSLGVWSWSSNTLATWCKEPTHWKRLWCLERLRAEKGATEDEMVGWYDWLNGHEFEQTPGDSKEQGSLACCSLLGCKVSDMTEWLNNNNTGCVSMGIWNGLEIGSQNNPDSEGPTQLWWSLPCPGGCGLVVDLGLES